MEQQGIVSKPRPRIGPDSRPFWDHCLKHQLALPFCEECAKPHLPAGPVCPFCLSERLHWREVSGMGVVSSWVLVHKAWFPAFAAEVPYNVIQVELAEGPRLTDRAPRAPGRLPPYPHPRATGRAALDPLSIAARLLCLSAHLPTG